MSSRHRCTPRPAWRRSARHRPPGPSSSAYPVGFAGRSKPRHRRATSREPAVWHPGTRTTDRNLVFGAPACTQRCAGEGVLVFSLTKHEATLSKGICAVNSQFFHCFGGLDRAGGRLGRESTERLIALGRHGVPWRVARPGWGWACSACARCSSSGRSPEVGIREGATAVLVA